MLHLVVPNPFDPTQVKPETVVLMSPLRFPAGRSRPVIYEMLHHESTLEVSCLLGGFPPVTIDAVTRAVRYPNIAIRALVWYSS